jgi:hypothetical protein
MAQFLASDLTLFAAALTGIAFTAAAILREFPSALRPGARVKR